MRLNASKFGHVKKEASSLQPSLQPQSCESLRQEQKAKFRLQTLTLLLQWQTAVVPREQARERRWKTWAWHSKIERARDLCRERPTKSKGAVVTSTQPKPTLQRQAAGQEAVQLSLRKGEKKKKRDFADAAQRSIAVTSKLASLGHRCGN